MNIERSFALITSLNGVNKSYCLVSSKKKGDPLVNFFLNKENKVSFHHFSYLIIASLLRFFAVNKDSFYISINVFIINIRTQRLLYI